MPTDSKCPAQPSEFSFPSSVTPESGNMQKKDRTEEPFYLNGFTVVIR
jgi:hypothetical protein